MRKCYKAFAALVSAGILTLMGLSSCGKGTSKKVKLYFDGGGGSGNYTTTKSYNTLQVLAEEWNRNNEKFEVVINTTSLNGNRSAITSMLRAGTAPDFLMQVGSVINDDIGNDWYVPLNEYLEKPNPYEAGNAAWKEIYGAGALSAAAASDNQNYYVCLDSIAIGMLYNMDVLKAAGITETPKNYSEFTACLETLREAKTEGRITADVYIPTGLWHENYLGTSVYGEEISEWDRDGSGTISTYELIKAYQENKWQIDDGRFREFLRLCGKKAEFYPDNYLGYDVTYKFAKGQLAVTDAVGNVMNTLAKNARFEIAVTGYPVLDKGASEYGGRAVTRGSAGLSSAYWITNSAMNKGRDAVDACADFLMYITASDNNSRLVNDLGYALPLDVSNSTVTLFSDLVEEYKADLASGEALMWSACYIPDALGTEFNEYYQLAMGDFYGTSKGSAEGVNAVTAALKEKLGGCIDSIIERYGWTFD